MDNNPFQSNFQPLSPPPPPTAPPAVTAFEAPQPGPGHHTPHHPHTPHHAQPYYESPPPPPPPAVPEYNPLVPEALMPQPVVKVLSPRGIEYVFMTIALLTGAVGLASALISMVNGEFGFDGLAFPIALMLVAEPTFAWLFLRLKRAELANPNLRLDASKRRSTQFIQIFSFLVAFFTLIGGLTTAFAGFSGNYHGSLLKVFLDVLVIELVAGGILYYYWSDEHRLV